VPEWLPKSAAAVLSKNREWPSKNREGSGGHLLVSAGAARKPKRTARPPLTYTGHTADGAMQPPPLPGAGVVKGAMDFALPRRIPKHGSVSGGSSYPPWGMGQGIGPSQAPLPQGRVHRLPRSDQLGPRRPLTSMPNATASHLGGAGSSWEDYDYDDCFKGDDVRGGHRRSESAATTSATMGVRAPRAQQAMPRRASYAGHEAIEGKFLHARPQAAAGGIGGEGRREPTGDPQAGPLWSEEPHSWYHDDDDDDDPPGGEGHSLLSGRNPANQHCDRTDPAHGDGKPSLGGRPEFEPPRSPVIGGVEVGRACLLCDASPIMGKP
jgi:hypothetical protein